MIEIRRHARWVALLGATAPLGLIGCTAADRAVLGATLAAAGVGITDARRVHVVGGAAFVIRRDASVLGWGNGRLASGGRRSPAEPDIPTPTR